MHTLFVVHVHHSDIPDLEDEVSHTFFQEAHSAYPDTNSAADDRQGTHQGYTHLCLLLALLPMLPFSLKPLDLILDTDDFRAEYPPSVFAFCYLPIFGVLTRPQMDYSLNDVIECLTHNSACSTEGKDPKGWFTYFKTMVMKELNYWLRDHDDADLHLKILITYARLVYYVSMK